MRWTTPAPDALFAAAGLAPGEPVAWGEAVPHRGPGVYVIADAAGDEATVVYIGRSVSVRRRIRQFYAHVHGDPRPHRGGQDILLRPHPRIVHWAPASDCAAAERALLDAFRAATGGWPMGNKVRSARPRHAQPTAQDAGQGPGLPPSPASG